MQVTFQTTPQEQISFLNYYFFKHKIASRITIIVIASLLFGSADNKTSQFVLSAYLLQSAKIAITFVLLILISYIISRIFLKKRMPAVTAKKVMTTDETGIILTSEKERKSWPWSALKRAEIIDKYLFIRLSNTGFLLIPVKDLTTENETANILSVFKGNIYKASTSESGKIRRLYYWGLLGFVPNFGLIAGIVILIKGISYKVCGLILVGLGCISFTIIFWLYIFPVITPDTAFSQLSQMQLNSLIKSVEFYKLQHGQYPDSLQQLQKEDQTAMIYDTPKGNIFKAPKLFHYQKVGDKYILFSSGPDDMPHTQDDLYPVVHGDSSKIGLIRER